jgi:hypothetical protein
MRVNLTADLDAGTAERFLTTYEDVTPQARRTPPLLGRRGPLDFILDARPGTSGARGSLERVEGWVEAALAQIEDVALLAERGHRFVIVRPIAPPAQPRMP